jgi:selenophosphate synthetase-related protein
MVTKNKKDNLNPVKINQVKKPNQRDIEIARSIEHVGETNQLRRTFWHMDKKVKELITGIQQGDDAMTVGRSLYNMEGPYPLKIAMKTGLIHSCSDIVVMGGRPLFAFNAMQVDSVEQAVEVAESLKKQSEGLKVPIIGGNTQMENDLKPCVSFVVVGELVTDQIIPDSTAKSGDIMLTMGEPVEGEIGDRVRRANTKFDAFLDIAKAIDVHSAKDCSRGGWFGNLLEMLLKTKKGFKIESVPYRSFTRYLGTYLLAVSEKDVGKASSIASKHGCPIFRVGKVTAKKEILLGDEVLINEAKMSQMIADNPFKKPNM